MIKAIETQYKGYRFRSRLEARWAVYFDAVGLRWEYEKEGFYLGDAGYYLPDFWFPDGNVWAEVKPGDMSFSEKLKAGRLYQATGVDVILLVGIPEPTIYTSIAGNGYGLFPYKGSLFATHYMADEFQEIPFARWPEWRRTEVFGFVNILSPVAAIEAARSARFEHGENPSAAVVG